MQLERLAARHECEELVTRYCHLVDHGRAAEIADLFTESGIWIAEGITMRGRDQLRRGFAARQQLAGRRSRHVCTDLLLELDDDLQRARGTVTLTLFRHDGVEPGEAAPLDAPLLVGEYRDELERTADGWRFARRELTVSFRRPRRPEGAGP